ncbi:hypothetical protein ACFOPQ_01190 [Deinococcus antarcticus]|uniref:Minor tail protein n=1 Tax=Deinococcus antarcticus TaxID=1298767 RepID=A0ABV8A120_9DEIO
MPYYPERRPWLVMITGPGAPLPHTTVSFGTETHTGLLLSPDQPGPPGGDWQLSGTWAFTQGPVGECRYGELGLTADPDLPLDQLMVLVWEQPDPTRPPDFRGTVGVVRGDTDLTGASYVLAIAAPSDDEARGLAAGSAYGYDAGRPLETVQEYCERQLVGMDVGGWGVLPDGRRFVGAPSRRGPAFSRQQVQAYRSSGYQRRESVNQTSATPGDRWAVLYDELPLPHPHTPRVYQASSSENLVTPDVERTPPFQGLLGGTPLGHTGQRSAQTSITVPATSFDETDVSQPPPSHSELMTDRQVILFRLAVPLSQLVRASARSKYAKNAIYDLKGLTFRLKVSGQSLMGTTRHPNYKVVAELPAAYPVARWNLDFLVDNGASPGVFLEAESTGSYQVVPRAYSTAGEAAELTLTVPEDLVAEVFDSIGGGHYWLNLDGEVTANNAWRIWERQAGDGPAMIYERATNTVDVGLSAPTMTVDALVTAIPRANYPANWGAPGFTPATAQCEIPGLLVLDDQGATVDGQPVSECRRVREYNRAYTEVQLVARQTQVLLPSEQRLKAARDARLGYGGRW